MNGYVKLGILMNTVGGLAAMAGLWTVPSLRMFAPILLVPIIVQGVGAWMIREERRPVGELVLGVGSALLLPIGAAGLAGAWRSYHDNRMGSSLGARQVKEERARPRAWTLATVVFAACSVAALVWALTWPRVANIQETSALLVSFASALLAVLCGLEAVLLWRQRPEAVRLGTVISVVAGVSCAVVGFYLHNYVAVGLLGLPVYALYLVWSGRERWAGFERAGDEPGEGSRRRSLSVSRG